MKEHVINACLWLAVGALMVCVWMLSCIDANAQATTGTSTTVSLYRYDDLILGPIAVDPQDGVAAITLNVQWHPNLNGGFNLRVDHRAMSQTFRTIMSDNVIQVATLLPPKILDFNGPTVIDGTTTAATFTANILVPYYCQVGLNWGDISTTHPTHAYTHINRKLATDSQWDFVYRLDKKWTAFVDNDWQLIPGRNYDYVIVYTDAAMVELAQSPIMRVRVQAATRIEATP